LSQGHFNKLEYFCENADLSVNLDKTKIIVFNNCGKSLKNYIFRWGTDELENSKSYRYLGLIMIKGFRSDMSITHKTEGSFRTFPRVFCFLKSCINENGLKKLSDMVERTAIRRILILTRSSEDR